MNRPFETIELREDETAVVGYGSLLSLPSISKTLGHPYRGLFRQCRVRGWHRSWNVAMPNEAFYYLDGNSRIYPESILYLNARPDPRSVINASIFVLKKEMLEAMHDREWIYDSRRVTDDLMGFKIEGGEALIYTGRDEYLSDLSDSARKAAVRASYLQMLEATLNEKHHDFKSEYEATTDPVPAQLVVEDMLDPRRPNPWLKAGRRYNPDI